MIIGSDFTVLINVVDKVVVVDVLSLGPTARFDDSRGPFLSIETKISGKINEKHSDKSRIDN